MNNIIFSVIITAIIILSVEASFSLAKLTKKDKKDFRLIGLTLFVLMFIIENI